LMGPSSRFGVIMLNVMILASAILLSAFSTLITVNAFSSLPATIHNNLVQNHPKTLIIHNALSNDDDVVDTLTKKYSGEGTVDAQRGVLELNKSGKVNLSESYDMYNNLGLEESKEREAMELKAMELKASKAKEKILKTQKEFEEVMLKQSEELTALEAEYIALKSSSSNNNEDLKTSDAVIVGPQQQKNLKNYSEKAADDTLPTLSNNSAAPPLQLTTTTPVPDDEIKTKKTTPRPLANLFIEVSSRCIIEGYVNTLGIILMSSEYLTSSKKKKSFSTTKQIVTEPKSNTRTNKEVESSSRPRFVKQLNHRHRTTLHPNKKPEMAVVQKDEESILSFFGGKRTNTQKSTEDSNKSKETLRSRGVTPNRSSSSSETPKTSVTPVEKESPFSFFFRTRTQSNKDDDNEVGGRSSTSLSSSAAATTAKKIARTFTSQGSSTKVIRRNSTRNNNAAAQQNKKASSVTQKSFNRFGRKNSSMRGNMHQTVDKKKSVTSRKKVTDEETVTTTKEPFTLFGNLQSKAKEHIELKEPFSFFGSTSKHAMEADGDSITGNINHSPNYSQEEKTIIGSPFLKGIASSTARIGTKVTQMSSTKVVRNSSKPVASSKVTHQTTATKVVRGNSARRNFVQKNAGKAKEISTKPSAKKRDSFSFFGNMSSKHTTVTPRLPIKSVPTPKKKPVSKNTTSFGLSKTKFGVQANALPRQDNAIPTIKNWEQEADGSITGYITNSPNFREGQTITTSPIKGSGIARAGSIATTISGSKYRLM